jgi:hypothetical protein
MYPFRPVGGSLTWPGTVGAITALPTGMLATVASTSEPLDFRVLASRSAVSLKTGEHERVVAPGVAGHPIQPW